MMPPGGGPRLNRYRLLAQVGAGPDGVSYRAALPGDEGLVEVRVLAAARADAARWPSLVRRLRRAQLLDHPGAVRIGEQALDDDPPFLVLEWLDGPTLEEDLRDRLPLPLPDALRQGLDLCSALLPAHRNGLAHGRLAAGTIRLTALGRPRLDFTGTATRCAGPVAEAADPAEDVAALGALLAWLSPDPALADLVRAMSADGPADRPTLREVDERLGELLAGCPEEVPAEVLALTTPDAREFGLAERKDEARQRRGRDLLARRLEEVPLALEGRQRLGRFRLLEQLGQGGMGVVYRAEDVSDAQVVAIKVLRPEWSARPDALRRLHKEARLLAEVNNPYVTNLLEVNEDDGLHYLVMEFVAGRSLAHLLQAGRPLDEPFALAVVADVCKALAEPHHRGIVHRDIKPDNILLVAPPHPPNPPLPQGERGEQVAKLSDFGLARHVLESESLRLTRTGIVIGTPLYLSPEQCSGTGLIGPRCDVYSLGATLFHLLAGRPPFVGEGPLALIAQHCNEPPPALRSLNPVVSEGVCRVVEKALAKKPEHRHADAGELLRDLRRLLSGEPVPLDLHPRLPACAPGDVLTYDFRWDLQAPPERLWPHVSNTERLNRAIGLPAIHYTTEVDQERVRRFAQARRLGINASWQEHPFEWIEARRFGVLREFSEGPFRWLLSIVELAPRGDGGSRLTHTFRLEPRGLLGRTIAAVEVGVKVRRALDRVYRRIDAAVVSQGATLADPFEDPARLSRGQRRRLDEGLDHLTARGLDPVVVERLGDFLALAAPQDVARIRPKALARRLGLDEDATVSACLHAAREGLLVLSWDLLCPICRIPSEVKDTLRQLRGHGRCEACNLDFELDFANGVELIFRAHPGVREAELGTYCIGGPAHSPHVAAQLRLAAGEGVELELALPEGAYRLRGPQLSAAIDFRVRSEATRERWELDLGRLAALGGGPWALHSGRQVLALRNGTDVELLVRVERLAPRDDAVTAARASALALFRELFPQEVLAPGQLVSVAALTFVVTDLEGAAELFERRDEARAFALVHEHLRDLEHQARRQGGALVKATGEGGMVVFTDPAAALRLLLELAAPADEAVRLRAGAHRGPALAATLTDHLDYFGATVKQALQLPRLARGGEWVLGQAVMDDPSVAALLRGQGLEGEVFRADLPGQAGAVLHRFRREHGSQDAGPT